MRGMEKVIMKDLTAMARRKYVKGEEIHAKTD
jgi:hypothetical protein